MSTSAPTVHDVAMFLTRKHRSPALIAAYLAVEEERCRTDAFEFVERFVAQLMAAEEHTIQHGKEVA